MNTSALRAALLAVFVLLFASACQSDVFVDVDVNDDGSGTVKVSISLDEDAAERTVRLEDVIPTADLEATGWAVSGPDRDRGLTWMRAEKEFANAEDLEAVIGEIAGAGGAFRDFELTRSSAFAKTNWDFRGTVDLTKGLDQFSDDELTSMLNGLPFGQSRANIEAGQRLEDSVDVVVAINLPGDVVDSNVTGLDGAEELSGLAVDDEEDENDRSTTTTDPRAEGREDALIWTPSFDDPEPFELRATTEKSLLIPRLWRWLAIGAVVAFALSLVYQLAQMFLGRLDDRRMQRRTESRASADAANRPVARPVVNPGSSGRPGTASGALRVVVLDQNGVLFDDDDVLGEILVPYLRERGCRLDRDGIADGYVARTLGATSSAEFWANMGITGDPAMLDDGLARRFELREGVTDFLAQARERGLSVAAVANDAADWSARLRQLHELDALVNPWVVSAEVGVRLPNRSVLDALQRATGRFPENCMLISRSVEVLDLAKSLGYRTVQLVPDGEEPESSSHRVLRNFQSVKA